MIRFYLVQLFFILLRNGIDPEADYPTRIIFHSNYALLRSQDERLKGKFTTSVLR